MQPNSPIEPACTAEVAGVEYPVHTAVATEMNRLRIAAMGGTHLITVATQARDEALDLLADILGPTDGPMTLPSAAGLEAWSNRARHLLEQRCAERSRYARRALPVVDLVVGSRKGAEPCSSAT